MSQAGLSTTVARARRAVVGDTTSDGRLLGEFIATRDATAFAELVARFGPMVFAVCRKFTGHHQDAEDAFQAAFVVLARKAASIVPREAVGNWLHGVAVRVAREARSMSARRLAREAPRARLPEAATPAPESDDAAAVLHEELAELPDKFRALLVLCDLRGEAQTEVAERLGIPVGTVYSRLATARKLLADRLRKRGVALSTGGLSVSLAQAGRAAVPSELSAKAVATALSPNLAPAAVAALSNGVFRAMFLNQLKSFAPLAVLIAAGVLASGLLAAEPPAPLPVSKAAPLILIAEAPKPVAQQPAAKPAGPGRLLVWKEKQYVLLTPDGKEAGSLDKHPEDRVMLVEPVLSPDGKRVAFAANEDPPTDKEGNWRRHLYYRDVDGKTPGVKVDVNALTVEWDADGKGLIVTEATPWKDVQETGFPIWRVDIATKEKTKLDLPRHAVVSAVMPDGKAFVASVADFKAQKAHLALISRDGKEVTKLRELRTESADTRPSPDGTKILFQDFDPDEKPAKDMPPLRRLYMYDLKTKMQARVEEVPENAFLMGFSWSPDGKKIAYSWKQVHPGVPLTANTENMNDPKINTETESHLIICDANGKNPKTILSMKSPNALTITIGAIDWR